jgi:hypothetical protein
MMYSSTFEFQQFLVVLSTAWFGAMLVLLWSEHRR